MEFETEANSTDKSQPFEINTEDITEHDERQDLICVQCLTNGLQRKMI